jgi:hypothetical protein
VPPTLFGVSRFFRFLISDKQAVERSLRTLLKWDFERIVVAHWHALETAAKPAVERALREAKLLKDRIAFATRYCNKPSGFMKSSSKISPG